MALSESSRMDYERHLLEHKPSITDNEARSPDKTVLGFDVGAVAGAERLVLKLATDKGTETLSLNPMIAHYLAMRHCWCGGNIAAVTDPEAPFAYRGYDKHVFSVHSPFKHCNQTHVRFGSLADLSACPKNGLLCGAEQT